MLQSLISKITLSRCQSSLVVCALLCFNIPVYADFKSGGDAYKSGDYETAAKEFIPLAENGDHRAMYALGSMYAAGHGVPMDLQEALKWFRKAAGFGRPDAQYKIGVMYARGLGINQDYRKALNWYGKSAKQGFGLAQYKLGQMYIAGHGVQKNDIKAYAWIKTAVSQGTADEENLLPNLTERLDSSDLSDAEQLVAQYLQKYKARY